MDMENFFQLLLALLAFVAVFCIGAAFIVARARHRRQVEIRLQDLVYEQEGEPFPQGGKREGAGVFTKVAKTFSPGKPSDRLRVQLARAGFHDSAAASVYLGAKVILLIGGALGAAAASLPFELALPVRIVGSICVGALLSFIPNIIVSMQREKRRWDVQCHLPDAVDLLEVCVSAGMGLDMAWNAVADEVRRVSDTLADEMALTNLEMHLGASRTVAMRHMVERTGADDLGSLVAVLVQSERFGTSVADALKSFALTMRDSRSHRAEEAAEKMAVKLLFPMVLFIFPVVLIVVAGPASMKLVEIMGGR
jgi:tight adherence protein C